MDLQTIGLSLGGSATVAFAIAKTLMRAEARAELKDDIKELHTRADSIEEDYVPCKFCNMQHSNLDTTLKSMDGKLDKLIEKL